MSEPLAWSIPLFRAAGILVRVHITYILVMLALFLREVDRQPELWFDFLMIMVVMIFVIILCHEFGHCIAARRVGGEADEILIWPLGGLAFCRPPMNAMAHFVTVIGGPLVNVAFCVAAGIVLLIAGFVPPLNPLRADTAYDPILYNFSDGKTYAPPVFEHWVKKGTTSEATGNILEIYPNNKRLMRRSFADKEPVEVSPAGFEPLSALPMWTARFFWLNWFLLLLNVLLPAYPLDGGRIIQCIVWGRTDSYERGTRAACIAGQVVFLLIVILALLYNLAFLFMLGVFILYASHVELRKLYAAETGEGFYDSSKGYQGFGDEEEDQPKRAKPKPGFFKRRAQEKAARRLQQEMAEREADDAMLDALLDKIGRQGRDSLTADEKRFLERMSRRERDKRAE